jgi:hypothetical protein
MSTIKIPPETRDLVRKRADFRCEYCQTDERLSGIACEIDHIISITAGGLSEPDNLCLACSACNGYKWAKIEGIDPETNEVEPLFHPRTQIWEEHFAWSEDGRYLIGLTPCGRATINTLQMNNQIIVAARSIWASFGLHPLR